jgi:hypothetical protein
VSSPGPSRDSRAAALESLRVLTRLFDEALGIPGTRLRVGLDAVIGLVPGVGDALSGLVAGYSLWVAARLGAPAPVLLRVLLNIAIDSGLGAIPLAGDLFDAAWKANRRNLDLLERWLASPAPTRRASAATLAGVIAAALAIIAGLVWLAVISVRALVRLLG